MAKTTNLIDTVCEFGQTCYCNPSFGQKVSRVFITVSLVLLIIMIVVYIIYLNRNRIALFLSPKLYYDCHGELPNNKNNDPNSQIGSQ